MRFVPVTTLSTLATAALLASAPWAHAQPAQPAPSSHGQSNTGVAGARGASPAHAASAAGPQTKTAAAAAANAAADPRAMEALQTAAQRLRDAIQTLAQAPAGEQRNAAIRQANRTLLDVHGAMMALPPEVQSAPSNEAHYKQAMDRLQGAAQRLRDAAQALAQQPASPQRTEAVRTINKALLETQQTMIEVSMAPAK